MYLALHNGLSNRSHSQFAGFHQGDSSACFQLGLWAPTMLVLNPAPLTLRRGNRRHAINHPFHKLSKNFQFEQKQLKANVSDLNSPDLKTFRHFKACKFPSALKLYVHHKICRYAFLSFLWWHFLWSTFSLTQHESPGGTGRDPFPTIITQRPAGIGRTRCSHLSEASRPPPLTVI